MNILQVKKYYLLIKQAKFTYSPLDKAFEEQITTIKDQGERQLKVLEEHGKQIVNITMKSRHK